MNHAKTNRAFRVDDDGVARLDDLKRQHQRHRTDRRVAEAFEAALGKRPIFRIVERARIPGSHSASQIIPRLRERHPAVRRVDDDRRSILAFHLRKLPDVGDLNVRIDERGHLAVNHPRHCPGLLGGRDQVLDTRRPFEHGDEPGDPHALKIRMAVWCPVRDPRLGRRAGPCPGGLGGQCDHAGCKSTCHCQHTQRRTMPSGHLHAS